MDMCGKDVDLAEREEMGVLECGGDLLVLSGRPPLTHQLLPPQRPTDPVPK